MQQKRGSLQHPCTRAIDGLRASVARLEIIRAPAGDRAQFHPVETRDDLHLRPRSERVNFKVRSEVECTTMASTSRAEAEAELVNGRR